LKDRVVQFPHRYQLVPVAGESDTYDIIAKPGTITEAGTPINKATLLSDETAALYDLTGNDATVDKALGNVAHAVNFGEYSQISGQISMNATGFMAFTNEDFDDFNTVDLNTYPTRMIVPSGATRIKLTFDLPTMSASSHAYRSRVNLYKNSVLFREIVDVSSSLTGILTSQISVIVDANGGDYFQIQWEKVGLDASIDSYIVFCMEVVK
jgi:hypothetical protein